MGPKFGCMVGFKVSDEETKAAVITRVFSATCVNLVVDGEDSIRTSVVQGDEINMWNWL